MNMHSVAISWGKKWISVCVWKCWVLLMQSQSLNLTIPYSYVDIFEVCKLWGSHKSSIFAILFSRITSPLNLRNIVSVSYQACCTCDMPKGITHYFKQCLIKKCTCAVSKLSQGPQRMVGRGSTRQWPFLRLLQWLQLVRSKLVIIPHTAAHTYPALQLMEAKVLPMKFQGWKFHGQLVDRQNHKTTSLEILYIHIWYIQ